MRRLLWLLPLAIAGVALVWVCTPLGLGLGGDSYYYVSGARNLLAGNGFARLAANGEIRPITHFPPLYSILLAGLAGLGIDTLGAARLFNSLLFGLNIFGIGGLLLWSTGSLGLACLGALLFLALPATISIHSWLLSEPLFLFLLIGSSWSLASRLESGSRRALLMAGLGAGLASLTRYTGLALVASGVLALVVRPGRTWRERLTAGGFYGGIGCLGPAVWAIRNLLLVGSTANRALGLHLPSAAKLLEGLETVSLWLLPSRVPAVVRLSGAALVAAAVVGAGCAVLVRSGRSGAIVPRASRRAGLHLILLCFVLTYVALLGLSLSFVDASTPLDDRILSPLLVALLVLGLAATHALALGIQGKRALKIGAAILLGGWLALTAVRGVSAGIHLRADGQGYASRDWQGSAIVQWVRELPDPVTVYSNELNALYLLTGRQAYQVPIRWDPVVAAPRQDYPQQLAAMRERIADQGAVLVLFDTLAGQQGVLPSEAELTQGLSEIFRARDGAIYSAGE
jgi:hypothetical protein